MNKTSVAETKKIHWKLIL